MTDPNGRPIREGTQVTTGGTATPLTVVCVGAHMIQVALERDGGIHLPWLHPSDVEVVGEPDRETKGATT